MRQEFLQLARLDPERYLVVDGKQTIQEIHTAIIVRVAELSSIAKAENSESSRLIKPLQRGSSAVASKIKKVRRIQKAQLNRNAKK